MPQDILQTLEHGRRDLEVGSVLHGAHLALPKQPICKRRETAGSDEQTLQCEDLQAQPHLSLAMPPPALHPRFPCKAPLYPSHTPGKGEGIPVALLATYPAHTPPAGSTAFGQTGSLGWTDRQGSQHSIQGGLLRNLLIISCLGDPYAPEKQHRDAMWSWREGTWLCSPWQRLGASLFCPQRQDGVCIVSMPLALESGEDLELFGVLAVRKVRLRKQRPAKPHLLPSYMWYYEIGRAHV